MELFKKDNRNMSPPPVPPAPSRMAPKDEFKESRGALPRGYVPQPFGVGRPQIPVAPPSPVPDSPPVFIKIDKYREVIKNLMEAKTFVLNIRDALDTLEDVQKEISNGVKVAQKTLDDLNANLSNLDSFFIKPGKGESPPVPERENPDEMVQKSPPVDTYVKNIYGQLERLRSQLKSLQ